MKLLAVDSSTEACSVALMLGDELIESYQLAPREHTRKLLPMLDELLASAELSLGQLDAIAFARGPGSFTGLRVCLSMVQGLAFGAGLPVVPVSSLAALAQVALDADLLGEGDTVVASLDARMDEIYWGAYQCQQGLVGALVEEQLCAPEALTIEGLGGLDKPLGVGPGFNYGDRLACLPGLRGVDSDLLPRAGSVLRLAKAAYERGESCSAEQALPTYLRDEVAWKKLDAQ